MKFKVGDVVKLEGVLVATTGNSTGRYPIALILRPNSILRFTEDGKYYEDDEHPVLELVSRPKKMIKVPVERWVVFNKIGTIVDAFDVESRTKALAVAKGYLGSYVLLMKGEQEVEVEEWGEE